MYRFSMKKSNYFFFEVVGLLYRKLDGPISCGEGNKLMTSKVAKQSKNPNDSITEPFCLKT